MRRISALLAVFVIGLAFAAYLARPGSSAATDGTLDASVGPGFTISLTQNGSDVVNLAPGTYTINVSDQSSLHNFHLTGPGVSQATSVTGTGSTTWTVVLATGSYHFQCDAHSTEMNGDFTVGDVTPTTTTTAPPPPPPPPAPAALHARIGAVHRHAATIQVGVSATRAGRATVDLLKGTKRLARATASIGTATKTVTLRPAHRVSAGRYTVRVRVTAGGASATTTKAVSL